MTDHCRPDLIQYDPILKVEHLNQDWAKVFGGAVFEEPEHEPVTDDNEIRKHFSHVTHDQVRQLVKIYQKDFSIFNYTVNKYVK